MEISILKLLQILSKRLLIIVIITALCAFSAFAYTVCCVKPHYVSSVKLMVTQAGGTASAHQIETLIRLVNSYVELLDSRDFYAQLAKESQLELSSGAVSKMVSYTINEQSEIFKITVSADTATQCQQLISTLVRLAPQRIENAFAQVTLQVIESPSRPAPTSSHRFRNTLLGAVLGALLCATFIIVRELFDTRCKDPNLLIDRYDLPVLGIVPSVIHLHRNSKNQKAETPSHS